MKRFLLAGAFSASFLLSGCAESLNNISESVRDKNIAAGSDTTGGNIELGSTVENAYVPNISLWFGRRRVWYVSLKKDADVSKMPEIIKSGGQPMALKGDIGGIGVSQGE